MADIEHEIKIDGGPERIRAALGSREALAAWHGGIVTGERGEWCFVFADGTKFRWQVVSDASDGTIKWRCVDGPGTSVGTEATFALVPTDKGRTLLEFRHAGWPDTSGSYRKCNTHWAGLLHHLRQYVETGKPARLFA